MLRIPSRAFFCYLALCIVLSRVRACSRHAKHIFIYCFPVAAQAIRVAPFSSLNLCSWDCNQEHGTAASALCAQPPARSCCRNTAQALLARRCRHPPRPPSPLAAKPPAMHPPTSRPQLGTGPKLRPARPHPHSSKPSNGGAPPHHPGVAAGLTWTKHSQPWVAAAKFQMRSGPCADRRLHR